MADSHSTWTRSVQKPLNYQKYRRWGSLFPQHQRNNVSIFKIFSDWRLISLLLRVDSVVQATKTRYCGNLIFIEKDAEKQKGSDVFCDKMPQKRVEIANSFIVTEKIVEQSGAVFFDGNKE